MQEQAISIREYARRRGCSDAAVRRAIADGRISPGAVIRNRNNGRPMILPSVADASWRQVIKGNNPRLAESVAAAPPGRSLIDIKRMSAEIDLQLKALELKERKGSLVDKEQVYSTLFEMGKEIKQEFETLPDRVIDNMLSAGNRNAAHDILAGMISETLSRISSIIERDLLQKR